jgi:hypothetical protein
MVRSIVRAQKLKSRRCRKKCIVIPGDGDPCPRCGNPMQIREYAGLNDKEERRPSLMMLVMNRASILWLGPLSLVRSRFEPWTRRLIGTSR